MELQALFDSCFDKDSNAGVNNIQQANSVDVIIPSDDVDNLSDSEELKENCARWAGAA